MTRHRWTTDPAPQIMLGYLAVACLGIGLTCALGCRQSDTPEEPASTPASEEQQPSDVQEIESAVPRSLESEPPKEEKRSARQVLEMMVQTYKKASSYGDQGQLRVRGTVGGRPMDAMVPFTVALARPNKLRMVVYEGVVVSDGEYLWGSIATLPNQVLKRQAPAQLTIESIYPNQALGEALSRGPTQAVSWLPPQILLLLADDPLKTLLHRSGEPELIEPWDIGPNRCLRVRIKRPDGTIVLWIDEQSNILRRCEFPTDPFKAMIVARTQAPEDQIQNLSLVADCTDAQLDGELSAMAFEFEPPPGAEFVEDFSPPRHPLLGQPVPDFEFVDLDGNPITAQSLAGKTTVIDFWATWCDPCRATLPELEQVYRKYKDNDQVAFLAVSVDYPQVPNEALVDTFNQLNVRLPIARDVKGESDRMFKTQSMIPAQCIVGSDGIVKDFKIGGGPPGTIAAELSAKLEMALAGKDVLETTLQQQKMQQEMAQEYFQQSLRLSVRNDLYVPPELMQPEIPKAEILERTEPHSLKLTQLWSCTDLQAPGNVLVVERPDGPPRLLVIDQEDSVAEIGSDGKVVATKSLDVPPDEPVMFLRTGVGADAKRYFVGLAAGVRQIHLFDEDFNRLLSFPQDARGNPHAGIADAQIADLDGDGILEIGVGYFDVVGVQRVSLEGQRQWSNRSVAQVSRIATLAPDAEGRRNLLCMNNPFGIGGTLVVIDPLGKRLDEIAVAGRPIVWITAEDLDDDGQSELCGLAMTEGGAFVAVGLNLTGEELWSYPLPTGMHEHQIEAVSAGDLLGQRPDQWLLAGADGTIHILGADGAPIDLFAYGSILTGLAAAEWDGRHVLLVCSTRGVDAWEVQPPPARP